MSDNKRTYVRTEKRKVETVEAVIKLCGIQNPSTLTTTDIANGVNLSQGALFKHFPNKGKLWEAVARWVANQMMEKVFKASEKYKSPMKGLEAMFLAHMQFVSDKPGVPKLMLGELQKPERTGARLIIEHVLDSYRTQVKKLLEEGIRKEELRADLDIEAAATLYLGSIQGLVIQSLLADNMSNTEEAAARVYLIYKQGIQGHA
ncbi:MAG: TetR/AcrR family transcriptional regulator [Marinobacter sp.]|uniref:TetR/AcrR family transcriptional regulator n=1 Tax=Marinobacter sp. TaxID=50741 RepID=UPI00396D123D